MYLNSPFIVSYFSLKTDIQLKFQLIDEAAPDSRMEPAKLSSRIDDYLNDVIIAYLKDPSSGVRDQM